MIQEGSKTLVIVGIVLGGLLALACLVGSAFLFLGMPVHVVPVSTPAPLPPPAAISLSVLADGGMFLGDVFATPADLPALLDDQFSARGDARVVIAADARVPHAEVLRVIDAVKQAGFTKLALAVDAK